MSEQQLESKREVRIHIDQHKYESPNPTTGAALYVLGKVAPGLELYREVTGAREDPPIDNGPEVVHLKEDEHFHSGPPKTYKIYVNGQEKVVTTKIVTFDEIVKLAFPTPPKGPFILFTVSYEDGPPANPQGSLLEGESVQVKNGMIFNVTPTDKFGSADLQRLRNEGYDLEIRSGYLLVKGVPYVNSRREVKLGILVTTLTLAGDETTRPDNHVAHFVGDYPCNVDGTEIAKIKSASGERSLAEGVAIQHSFSAKPKPKDAYDDYYEKVTTYVAILSGPASKIDPKATAKTFPVISPEQDSEEPFNYIDTASSRAEIVAVTRKLALAKVAIVGLGGTGSYVLDLVAKTPVRQIHLYDGDAFLQHNAFRSPGAPSVDELKAKVDKATYFKNLYSRMHRGIVDHAVYIDAGNVEQLRGCDFVFLCLDKGSAKKLIVEKLEEFNIPFVDVGMGVLLSDGVLGGIVRTTTSTERKRDHFRSRVSFGDGTPDDEYNRNIQIADLNALNAALAVIRWKKWFGFYRDLKCEHHSQYSIDGNLMLNEERPQ